VRRVGGFQYKFYQNGDTTWHNFFGFILEFDRTFTYNFRNENPPTTGPPSTNQSITGTWLIAILPMYDSFQDYFLQKVSRYPQNKPKEIVSSSFPILVKLVLKPTNSSHEPMETRIVPKLGTFLWLFHRSLYGLCHLTLFRGSKEAFTKEMNKVH